MNEIFFKELSRVLAENDIETGLQEYGTLPILLRGQNACRVQSNGTMCIAPDDLHTEEAVELYHKAAPFADMVYEYTSLLKRVPLLESDTSNNDYRLLSEFNSVILAGKEKGVYGFHFTTWRRDTDGAGFTQGEYFKGNYLGAKQDFAIRSGLVEKGRQFSDAQLIEIYRSIEDTLQGQSELTYEQEEILENLRRQIEYTVPNLQERIGQESAQCPNQEMNMQL